MTTKHRPYIPYVEDDIIHKTLKLLNKKSNEYDHNYYKKQLLPWKFKIKTSLIKKIKENNILNSIPESETIQNTIKIFEQYYLNSKNEVKYFFTIIGDIILKKNINIFFINNSAKLLLRILENYFSQYLIAHLCGYCLAYLESLETSR